MNPRSRSSVVAALLAGACVASTAFALSALASDAPPAPSTPSALPAPGVRTIDVSRVFDAGPLAPVPDIVITNTPADPTPLVERSQWVFDLRWEKNDVWLLAARPLELPAPQETPRAMGRFALELFEGAALLERVRFDFPLLGPPEANDGGWRTPPSIQRGLKTRIGVVFPAARRGTRLELTDRATGRRWSLPWPPQPPAPADVKQM
jgi:hypothetical protein